MEQSQQQSMRMVFVLMVSAVLCAIATFVAIALVIQRSDAPQVEGAQPEGEQVAGEPILISVAGTPIALYPDPSKIVLLASEAGAVVPPDQGAPETGDPTQATTEAILTADAAATQAAQVPPTSTPVPPTPVPPSIIFTSYVVQPGDSLYRITQVQNTSIDLMALYGISSIDMVAGNTLQLPIANPAYCPGMRAHIVRDQQTVFSISVEYGSSPDAIAAANGLDSNYTVKTTQVLCIP